MLHFTKPSLPAQRGSKTPTLQFMILPEKFLHDPPRLTLVWFVSEASQLTANRASFIKGYLHWVVQLTFCRRERITDLRYNCLVDFGVLHLEGSLTTQAGDHGGNQGFGRWIKPEAIIDDIDSSFSIIGWKMSQFSDLESYPFS